MKKMLTPIVIVILAVLLVVTPMVSYMENEAKEERIRQARLARLEKAQEECLTHLKYGWDFVAKADAVRALLNSSDPETAVLMLASYGGEEALGELLEYLDMILEKEYYGPA